MRILLACYEDFTRVLQSFQNVLTRTLQCVFQGVYKLFYKAFRRLPRGFRGFVYKVLTSLVEGFLHSFHRVFTRMLQCVYKVVYRAFTRPFTKLLEGVLQGFQRVVYKVFARLLDVFVYIDFTRFLQGYHRAFTRLF